MGWEKSKEEWMDAGGKTCLHSSCCTHHHQNRQLDKTASVPRVNGYGSFVRSVVTDLSQWLASLARIQVQDVPHISIHIIPFDQCGAGVSMR